jgi:WD40 repeat protein
MSRLLIATILLACSVASAQDGKEFVLAARRAGVVELLDPISLQTISRIHVDLPPNSVGLNGISANSDGSKIYVEGPIADDPKGCCSLYSIDLATLRMNQAASIAGRDSGIRKDFGIKGISNDLLHVSPDGHWLFGVRTFRGPALDIYDLVQGSIVRQLTPTGFKDDWIPSGAWSGDHFFFYASKADGSSARLWIVSASPTDLGEGVDVDSIAQSPGCAQHRLALERIAASANKLFVYEAFGLIGDRRVECPNFVQGGAWLIDSSSGRLLRHITPDLHFSILLSDRQEPVLFGLSNGGPNWEFPVKLLRIDAQDGQILQSRTLDTDRWSISIAPLRLAPEGDVQVIQDRRSTAHE